MHVKIRIWEVKNEVKKPRTKLSQKTDGEQSGRFIFYQPRLRMWRNTDGALHLAGEPDGLALTLQAFRLVARRLKTRSHVELRTEPIPLGRNPVTTEVAKIYSDLIFRFDRAKAELVATEKDDALVITVSGTTSAVLGFALAETLDGVGDFSLPVMFNGRRADLWFWGYANTHGVNSF
jgi:hypothetical protein